MNCAFDENRYCDEKCRWFEGDYTSDEKAPEACSLIWNLNSIRHKINGLEDAIDDLRGVRA